MIHTLSQDVRCMGAQHVSSLWRTPLYAPFSLALCIALLAGCASQKPTPPPSEKATSATFDLAQHLPDAFPYTISVRSDRFDDLDAVLAPTMRAFVANLPPNTSTVDLLLTAAFGNLPTRPKLNGLDPKKPILIGLLAAPNPALFRATTYGNLLDPNDAPSFLHNRAVLPAKDLSALTTSIDAWMQALKIPKASVKLANNATLYGRQGIEILVQSRENLVIVDLALRPAGAFSVSAKEEFVEFAQSLKPIPWKISSPARAHLFAHHNEAVTAYVDFDHFAPFFAAQTAIEVKEFTERTPDSFKRIFPYAARTTLNIADLMDPEDRTVQDMSIGIHASKTLDVTLIQSLTPDAAIAYAESEKVTTHRIEHVGSKPLATLRIGRSWNSLLSALSRPDWTQAESFEFLGSYLDSGSVTLSSYAFLSSTLDTFGHLTRMAQTDQNTLPAYLPDGLTLVIDDLQIEDTLNVRLHGGLSLQLPKNASKDSYTSLFNTLNTPLAALQLQGTLTSWNPSPKGHRAEFSLGDPSQKLPGVFKSFERNRDEANFDLLIHWPRIADKLQDRAPEIAKAIRALGVLTMQDTLQNEALITSLHLTLSSNTPAPAHSIPKLPAWDTKERNTLHNTNCAGAVTRLMFESNIELAEAKTADALRTAIDTYDSTLQKALSCYEEDPILKLYKDDVWSGWLLYTARLMTFRDDMPVPTKRIGDACALNRPAACQWQRDFMPK